MNIIQIFKFDLNFHLNFDDIHTQYIEFREISSENIWERQIWYQLSQKLRQIDASRFLHAMADIPEKSHRDLQSTENDLSSCCLKSSKR